MGPYQNSVECTLHSKQDNIRVKKEHVTCLLIDWPENLNLSPGSIRNVAVQDCTHADLKKILSDIQVVFLK